MSAFLDHQAAAISAVLSEARARDIDIAVLAQQAGVSVRILESAAAGLITLDAAVYLRLGDALTLDPALLVQQLWHARAAPTALHLRMHQLSRRIWTLLAAIAATGESARPQAALALAALLITLDLLPRLSRTVPSVCHAAGAFAWVLTLAEPLTRDRPVATLERQIACAHDDVITLSATLDPACAAPSHPIAQYLTALDDLLCDLTHAVGTEVSAC